MKGSVSIDNDPKFRDAFKTYSDHNILPFLDALETKRLQTVRNLKRTPVISFFAFIFFMICAVALHIRDHWIENWFGWYLVFIMVYSLTFVLAFQKSGKNLLLPKIIGFWTTLIEDERTKSEISAFWRPVLEYHKPLTSNFDYFNIDDSFCGKLNGITVTGTQLEIVVKGNDRSSSIFSGVAVHIKLEEKFKGQTLVFNKLISFLNFDQMNVGFHRIRLEDPEFEKYFSTYSNDQILSRVVLSPAFMERIKKLKILFNTTPLCSFKGDQVVILFPMLEDWFEPVNLFESVLLNKDINKAAYQIHLISEIIDTLKLGQTQFNNNSLNIADNPHDIAD